MCNIVFVYFNTGVQLYVYMMRSVVKTVVCTCRYMYKHQRDMYMYMSGLSHTCMRVHVHSTSRPTYTCSSCACMLCDRLNWRVSFLVHSGKRRAAAGSALKKQANDNAPVNQENNGEQCWSVPAEPHVKQEPSDGHYRPVPQDLVWEERFHVV